MERKKIINVLIFVLTIVATFYLIIKGFTKPLPGEAVDDMGRVHVTDIADSKYNSNPPTSGDHFPIWAKKGFYNRLISDGYLIHSMEHGYVVIWYDCSVKLNSSRYPLFNIDTLAHNEPAKESTDSGVFLKHMKLKQTGTMSSFTPENSPDAEILLPEEFKTESCSDLVDNLSSFLPKFERIIVAPRLEMDTPIAVTAWNRILKLDRFEEDKILEFIKSFHNKGPEKTIEN